MVEWHADSIGKVCLAGILPLLLVCTMPQAPLYASDAVERSGDLLANALPAAALITSLTERSREGTWQFVKATLVSQITVHTLKRAIDRTRPDGGRHAFPSGHTSSAFLGPGFVHLRYGFKYAWPMYLAAGYVGFTRVDSDRHYETDVLAGAAITMASCMIFVSPYNATIKATPLLSSDYFGLRLALTL